MTLCPKYTLCCSVNNLLDLESEVSHFYLIHIISGNIGLKIIGAAQSLNFSFLVRRWETRSKDARLRHRQRFSVSTHKL